MQQSMKCQNWLNYLIFHVLNYTTEISWISRSLKKFWKFLFWLLKIASHVVQCNSWFNIHVEHVINVATNISLSDRQTGLSGTLLKPANHKFWTWIWKNDWNRTVNFWQQFQRNDTKLVNVMLMTISLQQKLAINFNPFVINIIKPRK